MLRYSNNISNLKVTYGKIFGNIATISAFRTESRKNETIRYRDQPKLASFNATRVLRRVYSGMKLGIKETVFR